MAINKNDVQNNSKLYKSGQSALAGFAASGLAPTTTIVVAGAVTTLGAAQTTMQSLFVPFQTVAADRQKLKGDLVARSAAAPTLEQYLKDFETGLRPVVGAASPTLELFGFTSEKPKTPLTGPQLVARKNKAAATRARNGTLGKRQKQALAKAAQAPPPTPTAAPAQVTPVTPGPAAPGKAGTAP